jgi:hypothetical protein
MSVVFTTPYKVLTGGNISKWLAIHNNVIFSGQRKDHLVTSTANSGGNTQLNVAAGSVPAITAGNLVYISLASGVSGNYEVVSNTGTTIVIILAWSGSSSTGLVNLIEDNTNYLLTVAMQYSDDGGSTWTTQQTAEYQGSPAGVISVNVSPFLKSLVYSSLTDQTTAVNQISPGADRYCRLVFTESYTSATLGVVSQSAATSETFYIVNGAFQLQATNNVNYKSYLTNATPTQTLLFMSDFVKPTYFNARPFHLTFLYSELMTGTLYFNEQEFTAGSGASSVAYTLATGAIGHVNRYNMNGGYAAATDTVKVFIYATGPIAFSETKEVKYKDCTPRNEIYLAWMGTLGNWNFWQFGTTQTESMNVKAGPEFASFITDLSTADTDSDFLTKEATTEYTLGADGLDVNDINGLKTILRSPKVMMLMNPSSWTEAGTEQWQTVRILPSRFRVRETKGNLNSIEFTMQIAETYIQTN